MTIITIVIIIVIVIHVCVCAVSLVCEGFWKTSRHVRDGYFGTLRLELCRIKLRTRHGQHEDRREHCWYGEANVWLQGKSQGVSNHTLEE